MEKDDFAESKQLSLKGQGSVDFRLFGKGRTSGWQQGQHGLVRHLRLEK